MSGLNGLKLHHIGYAVRELDSSLTAFKAMGAKFFRESQDVERNIRFDFAYLDDNLIELVSPIDDELTCDISGYLQKQPTTPYHICYETENIDNTINYLRKHGFRPVGKKITSDIYGYNSVGIFMFSVGTGLIEIISRIL